MGFAILSSVNQANVKSEATPGTHSPLGSHLALSGSAGDHFTYLRKGETMKTRKEVILWYVKEVNLYDGEDVAEYAGNFWRDVQDRIL